MAVRSQRRLSHFTDQFSYRLFRPDLPDPLLPPDPSRAPSTPAPLPTALSSIFAALPALLPLTTLSAIPRSLRTGSQALRAGSLSLPHTPRRSSRSPLSISPSTTRPIRCDASSSLLHAHSLLP